MDTPVVKLDNLPSTRLLADNLFFPEAPRFFGGEIYFADGTAVRAVDLHGNCRLVGEIPAFLTLGISVSGDGTVYAAAAFEKQIYAVTARGVELAVDLSTATEPPINEIERLPNGGFIVGSMGWNPLVEGFDSPRAAQMLLVAPDGSVRQTGPELLFANGLILADNGSTLWVAEPLANTIHRFALGPEGDIVDDHAIVLQDRFLMDGISMAGDGSLWYSDMSVGAAVLTDQAGVTQVVVDVPAPRSPSCLVCEFDGAEWLVVCTAVLGPGEGTPDQRTGQIFAAPLEEIMAAAGR